MWNDRLRIYGRFSVCLLIAVCSTLSPVFAQEQHRPEFVTAETDTAIQQSLQWLAAQQNENGSFGSSTDFSQNIGVTAICGMAFMSSGSHLERGIYREPITRAVDFLLQQSSPSGFITVAEDTSRGPMYGHGFATMFLAEVYGTADRPELRTKLKRAVDLILATQNNEGGWRYNPVADEADISVTVCQVMALRAARNKGLAVPKETIDRAVNYIRQCQNANGGFRYRINDAAESKFPRTSAALVALHSAGIEDAAVLEAGLNYQWRYLPTKEQEPTEYHFYGQYYAALAAWHAGDEHWDEWYPATRDQLLLNQKQGRWSDPWVGDEYATAMALIVLQLPYDYVPIFQR